MKAHHLNPSIHNFESSNNTHAAASRKQFAHLRLARLLCGALLLIWQLAQLSLPPRAVAVGKLDQAAAVGYLDDVRASVKKSIEYLSYVMDQYHDRFIVYEDVSSAGNHFHAWAKFTDRAGQGDAAMNGSWEENTIGATSIRCEFKGERSSFAGFALLNGVLEGKDTSPRFNFGTIPNSGFNLTGATQLKFKARGEHGGERVTFFVGGVGREENGTVKRVCTEDYLSPCPAPDSSPAISRLITLTPNWEEYSIPLAGRNLSYVLGGFGWGASAQGNSSLTVFYLDDVYYELNDARRAERLNEPRLLRSFSTLPVQPKDMEDSIKDDDVDLGIRNTAFVYDNALALLAFLAEGSPDSLRRAKLIGDALIYLLNHDRHADGLGLRSMYAAGDISLPPGWNPNGRKGTGPASGYYDEKRQKFVELEENRTVDIGNQAWCMIALESLFARTGDVRYLDAAKQLGDIIRRYRQIIGSYQGFLRGIEEVDLLTPDEIGMGASLNKKNVREGASAEHNLDIYAAFTTLAKLTGDSQWQTDAEHARKLLEAMWDQPRKCFWAGTADKERIYRPPVADHPGVIPVDVQAWAVMAIPNTQGLHPQVLACVEQNHANSHHDFSGVDFNNDLDGVWFEGLGHFAVAQALARQVSRSANIRAELRKAQLPESYKDRLIGTRFDAFASELGGGNGTPAACHDGLTTGFNPPPDPITGEKVFHYHRRLHVGATSWNVFAQLQVNPYYLAVEDPTRRSFDVILQDDRSGDSLRFDSLNGEYEFVRCGTNGFTISGVGEIHRTGCLLRLENAQISAVVDSCVIAPLGLGRASLRPTPLGPEFLIEDRDITNNHGFCP